MVRKRMLRIIKSKETAKWQWLQNPSEVNGANKNSKRREASKYLRKREGISEIKN
jgi:hypothetical protein